tara:strand:+ start:2830 stop:3873 length:1044 start_codon:yes stop_codon:yes gene_type:complete
MRPTKEYSVRDTFGIDLGYEYVEDENGNPVLGANGKPELARYTSGKRKGEPIPLDSRVLGFTKPGPETPEVKEEYVFDREATTNLLIGMECGDRVLITGPTGSGKTTLVEQVAARLNYNFVKISFDSGITRDDLVGCHQYRPGEGTVFQEGILPYAMRLPGTIILFDEWDTIGSECSFVLQRVLQKDDGCLQILEKGGELIQPHPQNVFTSTANTIGLGDETGLYAQGTNVQNYAQLNRYGVTIKLDYLPLEQEKEMLRRRFIEADGTSSLHETEISSFCRAIAAVRDGYANGTLSVPLSPRDLINWAEKYMVMGDHMAAAKICFLNRMLQDDSIAVQGMIQRSFEQ